MRNEKRSSHPWSLVRNSGRTKALTINDSHGMPMLKFYTRGNEEADGRLMVAAPDLLDALKRFRTKVYNAAIGNGMDDEWATEACSLADAAIAKAEGGAA